MATIPYLIPTLLFVALVLPTLGALVARLAGRHSSRAMLLIGGISAGVAMVSVVALQLMRVDQVAFGRYAIFVPARAPLIDDQNLALRRSTTVVPTPAAPVIALVPMSQATATMALTILPTASNTAVPPVTTPTPTPTPTSTAVPAVVTPIATNTDLPTSTIAPRKTVAKPTATAVNKPTVRKYTVQKGDSLRSIAANFGVSVQALLDANGLSPKEGDNLLVGQKLIIPSH